VGVKPSKIDQVEDLSRFAREPDTPVSHRVSLYVPVDTAPDARHAGVLRLRAARDEAARRLRERGVEDEDVAARMERPDAPEPSFDALHPAVRSVVWLGDVDGWACSPLVEDVPEQVVVGDEFALRPLLRALQRDGRFRVLAISANRVAAWEGDARGLQPVRVEGLPASLEDALGSEIQGEGVSYRSDRPVPGREANAPVYHGHGGADEERVVDRERFHRALGRALDAAWGADEVPVVLAAEVRTASELRRHVKLPGLLADGALGNPDETSPEALHERTWPLARAALEARTRRAAGAYESARNAGKAVASSFDAVGEAAVAGRIRRLWVEEDAHVSGRFDPQTGHLVEAADPREDAVDGLVAATLRRGGEVHVVDTGQAPEGEGLCAELR